MNVHCPHCATGYLLPDHLIGPGGARVRCPVCRGSFTAAAPVQPPADEVAVAVVDALVDSLGTSLAGARDRGTVLSEHGPAIVAAYQEYRRRTGAGGAPGLFRVALRDRLGVDLIGRHGV